jgi:FKBP-type peptidyl-prolyl cis-trans isomerase
MLRKSIRIVLGGLALSLATAPGASAASAKAPAKAAAAKPDLKLAPPRPVSSGKAPTALVKKGCTASMQYAGWTWEGAKEFDSSWSRGAQPFSVEDVGNAPVIAGWNQGLVGMRVGGRRQIIIPPALGYGASGAGDAIPPNATLIFVVDAVAVTCP